MRIVYNSFHGRYSDSPRAIYEALLHRGAETEHLWLADPMHAPWFPLDASCVPVGTVEAVAALESADLIVSNSYLDLDWRKQAGATYVQTWHGTPLKRLHADALWGPEGLLDRLSLDVDRWDVLLSPNSYSTPILRKAFRWTGEILELGYPRNDVLSSPAASDIRDRVRRELGVPQGHTAVLYTPTWRDDTFWEGPSDTDPLELDLHRFTEALGADHVLLIRLHYSLTGRLRASTFPAVRDVSFVPDIGELYLAADVLVTDYSSTMFDFAATGKPMLFYTYDLERYRDELRGFYFDLTADPPGPLVRTTDELVAGLRQLDTLRTQYADSAARFRDRFCALADGGATSRLVQRLLPR